MLLPPQVSRTIAETLDSGSSFITIGEAAAYLGVDFFSAKYRNNFRLLLLIDGISKTLRLPPASRKKPRRWRNSPGSLNRWGFSFGDSVQTSPRTTDIAAFPHPHAYILPDRSEQCNA